MGQAASRENGLSTTDANQRAEDAIRSMIALRNETVQPGPREPDTPMQEVAQVECHDNDTELQDAQESGAQRTNRTLVVRKAVPREASVDVSRLALYLQHQGKIRLNAAEERVVEAAYMLKVLATRRSEKNAEKQAEKSAETKVVEVAWFLKMQVDRRSEKQAEKMAKKKAGKRRVRAPADKSIRKNGPEPVGKPVCEPATRPVHKLIAALKPPCKPVAKPKPVPVREPFPVLVLEPTPAPILKPVRQIINERQRDKKAGLKALIAGRTKKAEMALEAC